MVDTCAQASWKTIIQEHLRARAEPAVLCDALKRGAAGWPSAAAPASQALIESIAPCLKSWEGSKAGSAAAVFRLVPGLLAAWDRLAQVAASEIKGSLQAILQAFPESFLDDGKWIAAFKTTDRRLGRKMSAHAAGEVASIVGPKVLGRWIKADISDEVLASLVEICGDRIEEKTLCQAFGAAIKRGVSPVLAKAVASSKHRVIVELLPLDIQGGLGDAIPHAVLGAAFVQAPRKTVVAVLRKSGSEKVISCSLRERVLTQTDEGKARNEYVKSFLEGLQKFSDARAAVICGLLFETVPPTREILQAVAGPRAKSAWATHAKRAVTKAAVHALGSANRRNALVFLLRVLDEAGWTDQAVVARVNQALDGDQAPPESPPDDQPLRWAFCDRILECLDSVKELECLTDSGAALVTAVLADFGLRIAANAGDSTVFDSGLHETTLWGCRPGEEVVLQTDLLRLDDAVAGPVVRRARVLPANRREQ